MHKEKFKNTLHAYEIAAAHTILHSLSAAKNLTLVFEERNGVTENTLANLWKKMWPDIFRAQIMPLNKCYYPSREFVIRSKHEPGLQVVDFLLWASARRLLKKTCPWFERITKNFSVNAMPIDRSVGSHSFYLKYTPPDSPRIHSSDGYSPAEFKFDDPNFLATCIINSQTVINSVVLTGKSDRTAHFWEDLKSIHDRALLEDRAGSFIVELAENFLRLFDNIGLISKTTSDKERIFWLHCKSCMAKSLCLNEESGRAHHFKLSTIRHCIMKQSPDCLVRTNSAIQYSYILNSSLIYPAR